MQKAEAIVCAQIDKLTNECTIKNDWKTIEGALHGRTKQFKKKTSEISSDRETAEDALCCKIEELKATLQNRYCQHVIHTEEITDMFQGI